MELTETGTKSTPYAGEGLIGDESYLRTLPRVLSVEERMRYDAIVTAADIIAQSFSTLQRLTGDAKAETGNFNYGLRAILLSLCWTIVDQLHAVRQLLEPKRQGTLTTVFREAAATATLLRNGMDHLSERLKNISSSKGLKNPLFGSLSYFYAPDAASAVNEGKIITIMAGGLYGGDLLPLINPVGYSYTVPTCLFTLSAFGQDLELGHVIGTLRDLLRKTESSLETDIRKQVEAQARTPEEIDQAMASLGGGLMIVASISFDSTEKDSDPT